MTLKALAQKLGSNKDYYLSMYFVLNDNGELRVRLVDLEKEVEKELSDKFVNFIQANYSDGKYVIGALSEADSRQYDVLEYDVEFVTPLNKLEELLADPDVDKYAHHRDGRLKLDGYIFIIGNKEVKFSFYKEHYSMFSITRDSFVIFGRSDSRFVEVDEEEIFRLNNKIDFIYIDGTLYVLNMKVMESNFKIHDVLKKMAKQTIKDIKVSSFVDNPAIIKKAIDDSPAFARKVLKINKESPVIKLPFRDIKKFVQGHPTLKDRLKINSAGKKFDLDTRVSVELFFKLMDDDFLKSELTQRLYESIAKDEVTSTE